MSSQWWHQTKMCPHQDMYTHRVTLSDKVVSHEHKTVAFSCVFKGLGCGRSTKTDRERKRERERQDKRMKTREKKTLKNKRNWKMERHWDRKSIKEDSCAASIATRKHITEDRNVKRESGERKKMWKHERKRGRREGKKRKGGKGTVMIGKGNKRVTSWAWLCKMSLKGGQIKETSWQRSWKN